jgi:hypothetical protein
MLRSILQRIRARYSTTEPNIVVRGRFRVWQWIIVCLAIALPLVYTSKLVMPVAMTSMIANICEAGPLGITIGWWHFIAMFAIPLVIVFAVGSYAIYLYTQTRSATQYPSSHTKLWVDTKLLTGRAVHWFALKNLLAGCIAIGFTLYGVWSVVDITLQFGKNMSPAIQEKCRTGLSKT